jgi:hypothetical protein
MSSGSTEKVVGAVVWLKLGETVVVGALEDGGNDADLAAGGIFVGRLASGLRRGTSQCAIWREKSS